MNESETTLPAASHVTADQLQHEAEDGGGGESVAFAMDHTTSHCEVERSTAAPTSKQLDAKAMSGTNSGFPIVLPPSVINS